MKKLSLLFALFLAFACTHSSLASHIYGSDMSWESLGGDSFLVVMTVLRDCNGVGLAQMPFTIESKCDTFYVPTVFSNQKTDITPLCTQSCSRCSDPQCSFAYGIETESYSAIVKLADIRKNGCCEVRIVASGCCFSSAYTNMNTGGFKQEIIINICNADGLSSPQYDSYPFAFACVGVDFSLSHKVSYANDTINNSDYVYSLNCPNLTYSSPYSITKPLNFLSFPDNTKAAPRGFHLDSITGRMQYRPMKQEITMMGIKVEQYKNGKHIGTSYRQFTNVSLKCPSTQNSMRTGFTHTILITKDEQVNSILPFEFSKALDPKTSLKFTSVDTSLKIKYPKISGRYLYADLFFDPSSLNLNPGDTLKRSFTLSYDYCPFPFLDNVQINFIVAKKDTTKYKLTRTQKTCGKYELSVQTSYPEFENLQWKINNRIVHNSRYFFDSTYSYTPLEKDTQFIEAILLTEDTTSSSKALIQKTFYDTIVPNNVGYHLKLSTSDTSYCPGETYKNEVIFATHKTYANRYKIYWDYMNIHSSSEKIEFEINNLLNNTVRVNIRDFVENCSIYEDIIIPVKKSQLTILDTQLTKCTSDTFSFGLRKFNNGIGKWYGPGVKGNRFYSDTLDDGSYILSNKIESKGFCDIKQLPVAFSEVPKLLIDTLLEVCHAKKEINLNSFYPEVTWTGQGMISNHIFKYTGSAANTIVLNARITSEAGCSETGKMKIHVGGLSRPNPLGIQDTAFCFSAGESPLELSGLGTGSLDLPATKYFKRDGKHILKMKNFSVGNTKVQYYGPDKWGCPNSSKFTVTRHSKTVGPVIATNLNSNRCEGDTALIELKSNPQAQQWKGDGVIKVGKKFYLDPRKLKNLYSKITAKLFDNVGCPGTSAADFKYKDTIDFKFTKFADTICENIDDYFLPQIPKGFYGKWTEPTQTLPVTLNKVDIGSARPTTYNFKLIDTLYLICTSPTFNLTVTPYQSPKLISDTFACSTSPNILLRKYPQFVTTWEGDNVFKSGSDYYLDVKNQVTSLDSVLLHVVHQASKCSTTYSNQVTVYDTMIRPYALNVAICAESKVFRMPDFKDKKGQYVKGFWSVDGTSNSSGSNIYIREQDSGMQKAYFTPYYSEDDAYYCLQTDTSYIDIIKTPFVSKSITKNTSLCIESNTIYNLDNPGGLIFKGNKLDSNSGIYYYNLGNHNNESRLKIDIYHKGQKCASHRGKVFTFKTYISKLVNENDEVHCREENQSFQIKLNNPSKDWEAPFEIINNDGDLSVIPSTAPAGTYRYVLTQIRNVVCKDSVEKFVTIVDKPDPTFTIDPQTKGKIPFSVTFQPTLNTKVKRLFWELGNGDTLSSTGDQNFIYTEVGKYKVTLTAYSKLTGCIDTSSAFIIADEADGVNNLSSQSITVYPNPSSNTIWINIPNADFENLTIYNSLGQEMKSKRIENLDLVTISISELPQGSYILELTRGQHFIRKTFIKK